MYAEYNSTKKRVFNELVLFERPFSPALAEGPMGNERRAFKFTVDGMLKNPILKEIKIENYNGPIFLKSYS